MPELFRAGDALDEAPYEAIARGAVLLRGYALPFVTDILASLEAVATHAPFRHMTTPWGAVMSVAMTNCGDAGWLTDRSGYRYDRVDPESGLSWPTMPDCFRVLATDATNEAGYPAFVPDACLINRYEPGTRLTLHQDKNERDYAHPIVSVSLGLPATFLFGGLKRSDAVRKWTVRHGDVAVWGSPSRLYYHGVADLKKGEDSSDDISRGLFSGEVGSPRLLKLFSRLDVKTTWFIPGHSIETFPNEMKAVAEAGHEIGIHGYSHENPIAMTREQETAILDRCIDLVTQLTGKRPTGYVAPWWEFSTVTNELLLERGIKYDHSLMHHDHQPYYVRVGGQLDQDRLFEEPVGMDGAAEARHRTGLIEIPASWYLDDLPPMLFIKKSPNSHGFVNPRDIEEMWRDQFDWVYREYDYAVFPMTIHPDVSGRPHVLMMLERLYHHMIGHPGVRFVTMNEMADDFARRIPRKT